MASHFATPPPPPPNPGYNSTTLFVTVEGACDIVADDLLRFFVVASARGFPRGLFTVQQHRHPPAGGSAVGSPLAEPTRAIFPLWPLQNSRDLRQVGFVAETGGVPAVTGQNRFFQLKKSLVWHKPQANGKRGEVCKTHHGVFLRTNAPPPPPPGRNRLTM